MREKEKRIFIKGLLCSHYSHQRNRVILLFSFYSNLSVFVKRKINSINDPNAQSVCLRRTKDFRLGYYGSSGSLCMLKSWLEKISSFLGVNGICHSQRWSWKVSHLLINKIQSRSKFIWILMFNHENIVQKICALQEPDKVSSLICTCN